MAVSDVLVLGSQGQVGQSLRRIAPQFEYWDRSQLDLSNIEDVARTMRARKPDTVINLAAYTQINANGSEVLAKSCRRYFYISTDYVYPGTKASPYIETDSTDPVNHYGLTKLQGEQLAQKANPNTTIIRTSWVISEFGVNFVKRMLELGRARPELSVVNDQIGSPTYAHDLAEVLLKMVTQNPLLAPGVYHYSSEGAISWYDLAAYTLQQAGIKTPVKPIPTSAYPTKAKRPAYSVLDKSKIKLAMGLAVPPWQDAVNRCLKGLL
jgi:dTDP-4-dehydrorhamnose reductase